MFNFTPLLGAQSSSPASQSLLEFEGGIKVLVDVGWDSTFDVSKLKELERHVPTLSLVLLTHATEAHLAAFAHCCKHFPLFTQIPIYATLPVIQLGRTLLQDIYASTPLASSIVPASSLEETSIPLSSNDPPNILLQPPTAEEIASYFSLINPLKYSQSHQPLPSPFSPPLNGLTITAYNAGHSLGGTIWHIQHGMESVVYAVDWNQVRENVYSGAAWLGSSATGGAEVIEQLRQPTALVCSAKGVEKPLQTGGRGKRDELLLEHISHTLARGGSVLIPTDTSARVLELSYLLEHAWRKEAKKSGNHPFKTAKAYLASRNVGATMRYARSMLEWMDSNVIQEFETEGANAAQQPKGFGQAGAGNDQHGGPFDFKHLRLVERKAQIENILSKSGPQVILASDVSLAWGFSKDALVRLAENPANLVILTEDYSVAKDSDQPASSVGQILWKWYQERQDGVAVEKGSNGQTLDQVYTGGKELDVVNVSKTPLEGNELLMYQQFLATQRQIQTMSVTGGASNLETSADAVDDASSSSSSSEEESDDEQQGKALNYSTTFAQANRNKALGGEKVIGINVLVKEPGVYDYDVRGKKGRDSIFPYVSKRRRADEFGDLIRPEDYLRAEERDEVEGQDLKLANASTTAELGQKRKWDDVEMVNGLNSARTPKKKRSGSATNADGYDTRLQNGVGVDDGLSDLSDSESEDVDTGPTKVIFKNTTVTANLRIAFVDFAGIHDQRNMSMLIPLIKPRKVVLVGGSESETRWLADECAKKLRSSGQVDMEDADDIFTPVVGETVTASMDTNAWTLKLSNFMVRKLRWQNVRGLSVATLMGQVITTIPAEEEDADAQSRKRQKTIKEEAAQDTAEDESKDTPNTHSDLPPTLDVLPASMAAATRTFAQPLHVGDLRLADLRKILQSTGHTAEFRGQGTLVVDGVVAVRKSSTGQIEIESNGIRIADLLQKEKESSFQTIRSRIYEGLAVIAGG